MTDTKPQGVAQRVIAQWKREPITHREMYGVQDGLKIMHRELSTEARRVMAELDQHVEQDGYGFWFIEIEVLRNAFTRLGLDLNEPEDSDE